MTWGAVLLLSAGAYLAKVVGLVALRDVPAVRRALPTLALLPPAVLAGLVVTQVLGDGSGLVLDERILGIAAAGVAVWRRTPFLVVVGVAAGVTAAARALG